MIKSFLNYLLQNVLHLKKRHTVVLHSSIISSKHEEFCGWPTVARDANGTLFVGYSGGRIRHCDPYGKNYLIHSNDRGVHWSKPILVNDSLLDDRDAGLLISSDQTLIYSYFNSIAYKERLKDLKEFYGDEIEEEWKEYLEREIDYSEHLGSFIRQSKDEGITFSEPYRSPVSTSHGPIEGFDKNLYYLGNLVNAQGLAFYISTDQGKTWELKSEHLPARLPSKHYLCEPHVIQVAEHIFMALFRANHKRAWKRVLFQSWSDDGGATWGEPIPTKLFGYPPHLLRHSSGKIIVTYGVRTWPYSIRVSWSDDNGKTWQGDEILSIASDSDLGYPSTVELDDHSLYTVFYQIPEKKLVPAVYGVHWHFVY
jgi:sialidase-1